MLCIVLIAGVFAGFYFLNELLIRFDSATITELAPARVSHWSGYIINLDVENKTEGVGSISASWVVPQIAYSTNDTYSSVWVGVGGYGEKTLIQAGTEHQVENGKIEYFAWYELLPATIVRVPTLGIEPGDTVTTSISLVDQARNSWVISIVDETEGRSFQKTVTYNSSMKSAEWIVERPTVNNQISTLADFGTITLTDCKTSINGVSGSIKNFTYTPAVMVDSNDTDLVSVSKLGSDGSSFTVTYIPPSANTSPNASPLSANFLLAADARKP